MHSNKHSLISTLQRPHAQQAHELGVWEKVTLPYEHLYGNGGEGECHGASLVANMVSRVHGHKKSSVHAHLKTG